MFKRLKETAFISSVMAYNKDFKWLLKWIALMIIIFIPVMYIIPMIFVFRGIYENRKSILINWISWTWYISKIERKTWTCKRTRCTYYYQPTITYTCWNVQMTEEYETTLNKNNFAYSTWDEIKVMCIESNPSLVVIDDWTFELSFWQAYNLYIKTNWFTPWQIFLCVLIWLPLAKIIEKLLLKNKNTLEK